MHNKPERKSEVDEVLTNDGYSVLTYDGFDNKGNIVVQMQLDRNASPQTIVDFLSGCIEDLRVNPGSLTSEDIDKKVDMLRNQILKVPGFK